MRVGSTAFDSRGQAPAHRKLVRPGQAWGSRRAVRENLTGYLLILPWLLGFAAWVLTPMAVSLYLAFCRYNLFKPPVWAGLANVAQMARDDLMGTALFNTAFYTFIGVPIYTCAALLAAVLLNQRVRGVAVFRTLYYLPTIVPAVASGIIWLWLFNPEYGLANAALRFLGLHGLRWFNDVHLAKPLLILVQVWAFGPALVLFLAALQNVPRTLVEAALIDGAGAWQRFRHVTLPMISPVLMFNLVTGFIASLQVFTPAYIITEGGPAHATLFYVLYLYRQAMFYQAFGYAAAMSWLLFAIILALTLLQLRLSQRWVYYEAQPGS